MLQDLGNIVYDNNFKLDKPQEGDYLIMARGNTILINEENIVPRYSDKYKYFHFVYLFTLGEGKFFACLDNVAPYDDYTYRYFSRKLPVKEKWLNFGIAVGSSFAQWYNDNKFCGRCGKMNRFSQTERMLFCDKCKTMLFPKLCPAVIVAVIDRKKDRIVVTKREVTSTRPALVSGFCEVGETAEETCRREVMEEVGVKIKNIKFYKSQPWPFSNSLLLGFVCDLDGDDTLTVDYNENVDAYWQTKEEVGVIGNDFALTREMLDEYAKGNL